MSTGNRFIQGQQGPLQPDDIVIEAVFRIRDHQGTILAESDQAYRITNALGPRLNEGLLDEIEDAYHTHGSMPAAMTAAMFVGDKLKEASRERAINPSFKASEKWIQGALPPLDKDPIQRPGSYFPEVGMIDSRANRAERWSHGLASDYGRFRSVPSQSPESNRA